MNIDIHPIFLIAVVSLLGTIACIIFACFASRWLTRGVLIMVALVLLAPSVLVAVTLKPEIIDGRFRTYKRFYRDIQVGMLRNQVMGLVNRHYPSDGIRHRPNVITDTKDSLSFFMNSEGAREPNCEGIFLLMQNYKVVKKQYSVD